MKFKNKYYGLRHGESTGNVEKVIASLPENAKDTCGLTKLGKKQALETGNNNKSILKNAIFYSSDFLRAKETAKIVADLYDTNVCLAKELRERIFGDLELKPNYNYNKVWLEDALQKVESSYKAENVFNVLNRVLSLVYKIEQEHKNKNIILTSHGDTLQITKCYFSKINPYFHRSIKGIDNAELVSFY